MFRIAFVLFTFSIIVSLCAPVFAAPVEVSGVIFTSYSAPVGAPGSGITSFDVPRAYVNFKTKLSDNAKARVTLDIKQLTDVAKTASTTEGSSMNGTSVALLKYAFVELTDIVPTATLVAGMHELPWVGYSEKIWGFRYVAKSFSDDEGKLTSADLGIGLKGKLLGFVDYAASVVNGGGSTSAESNNDKDLEARVSMPLILEGLGLDLGLRSGGTPNVKRNRTMAIVSYKTSLFTFAGEALGADDAGKLASGLAWYGNMNLFDMATLFARTSQYDPDIKVADNQHTKNVIGLEKKIADGVKLAVDYQNLVPSSLSTKAKSDIWYFNLEISY